MIDAGGAITAGLPMIRSKLPWRRRWTSLPFTDALEPVAADRQQRDELLRRLAAHTDTEPVLIRTRADLPGWTAREVGSVQILDLAGGADGVLRNASNHHRRAVTRSRRSDSGLSARTLTDRDEFLGASLALTARSRRRLGTPTQPQRYWSRLWDLHEQGRAMTLGVYADGRLVSSGIFVLGREHAVYKYGASDATARKLRASFLMFATAFDELAARGVRSMDFGITDLHNESLREFKRRWGGQEQPAHFSATDARLLPDTLEPGRLLTKTIQHAPVFFGRTVGSLAYPYVA